MTKIYKLFVWNEYLKNFVCKLKPIIIESYTESNESLKITRLRKPDRLLWIIHLLLKQTQAYNIRLIASGIDTIHNCPKCLKEKHFQKFRWPPNLQQMVQSPIGIKSRCYAALLFGLFHNDTTSFYPLRSSIQLYNFILHLHMDPVG